MRTTESTRRFTAPLAWTTLALTTAIVLHASHLPPWVTLSYLLLVAWRALLGLRGSRLPSRALRLLAVICVVIAVVITFGTLNGIDAGTAMLTLMAGLKLLETRTPRDHVVLLLIGYILVLAAFLYAQQLWLLPLHAAVIWLITTALLRATQRAETQSPGESARFAGTLLLQATPLMLAAFVVFPRVPGPFWALPDASAAVTGLGDEMSPGDISELSLQSTPAFRVRFDGPVPAPAQRYWRGPVLHEFDGYTWSRTRGITHERNAIEFSGPAFNYSLMLEANGKPWIFALDLPEQWHDAPLFQTFDFQLLARDSLDRPATYQLSSRPTYRAAVGLGGGLSKSLHGRDTRLPDRRNPRARELAQHMYAAAGSDPQRYVRSVLQMFRDQQFYYTLTPPRLSLNSVDDFLFDTRAGFCGHFASAFTTLMRAAQIPARVVTGYQGGELNRFANFYIVRQSDAHAWSEVWFEGRGWTRIDPTAFVAPERIERGLIGAVAESEPVADRYLRTIPWLAELRFAWDALDTAWRAGVVDFDMASQDSILRGLGFDAGDWRVLGLLLTAALAIAMALLALQLRHATRAPRPDAVQREYARFCARLTRHGLTRALHEGPLDFARRVARERPDLSSVSDAVSTLYLRLRYEPQAPDDALPAMRRFIRSIP